MFERKSKLELRYLAVKVKVSSPRGHWKQRFAVALETTDNSLTSLILINQTVAVDVKMSRDFSGRIESILDHFGLPVGVVLPYIVNIFISERDILPHIPGHIVPGL